MAFRALKPGEEGGGWLAYFVRHRTAANLLLAVMVALGITATFQIRAQFFPDVVIENVRVSTSWSGAAATDMDEAVVAVMEPSLAAVEGVTRTFATSREGSSSIRVDFEPGWDMARAAGDVETAIGQIRGDLPDGADDPVITRGAFRDRVVNVILSGPVPVEQLARYADELTARFYREGVTRVDINGVQAGDIYIDLTQGTLIRHDLSLSDIARAVQNAASTQPAGDVADGAARVRTGLDRRDPDSIGAVVVTTTADGAPLLLRDIAEVSVGSMAQERSFFRGEANALRLVVQRSAAGDAIAIEETVARVAAEMAPTLPAGSDIELTGSRAQIISDRIDLLLANGLTGLALVVGLLFLFLSARTAFWVAAGIPVAMVATLAMMFAAGLTLNLISLFALIICLGIVVDDAIVVAEHADHRHRDLGEPPAEAAINAARRMGLPVLSATITTVLAFGSLALIGGVFGDLIRDIPFTVPVVLLASLIECFLILPAHMRHAFEGQAPAARGSQINLLLALVTLPIAVAFVAVGLIGLRPSIGVPWPLIGEGFELLPFLSIGYVSPGWALWSGITLGAFVVFSLALRRSARLRARFMGVWYDAPSAAVNRGFDRFRRGSFRAAVTRIIRWRYPLLALAVLLLSMAINLFQAGDVRWRFFDSPERNTITGNIAMLPGTPRAETRAMVLELERATQAVAARIEAETGVNPVAFSLTVVGATSGRGLAGADNLEPDQLGSISVDLIDADKRENSSREISGMISDEVRRPAALETFAFRGERTSPGGDNLDVAFTGAATRTLKEAAQAFIAEMEQFAEVTALEDSLPYDKAELRLELTDAGRALGFEIGALSSTLRDQLEGVEALRFPDGTRTASVTVRLDPDTLGADFLDTLRVRAPSGAYVYLSEIVTVEESLGFSTIRRDTGLRTVT
ncbi:MAG: efflux RND transporter permease subunit, partial [Pseudomonadota bacterium]